MSITISPVTPSFAAEIGDVDLANLSESQLSEVKEAFWKFAVLVFPDQKLSANQHLAFARHFGPIETDRVLDQKVTPHRLDQSFADISNLSPEGRIWDADSRQRMYKAGNKLWHT
ncbi:MAG TPA: TauD/TfdA family dioxygenase, partial [Burkholderiales bacterium]|nr:TauD/TfdA family dioxygenase [Burkholderiales bacterium]